MNIKKGKPGGKHRYEFSLKRKVCEELLGGSITIRELARKYNIPGAGTIMRWVNWYQQEQAELTKLPSMSTEPIKSETDSLPSNSSEEYRKLQEELKLAKLKVTALETMIDIAEDQFNIEIRKKPGTKPLEE
jgi:transposase